ncbi:hypothetical protein TrCOL_g2948 [Triparma columacea]|uniref:Uncharacterized protein n=1 Tax=Triparma columacea TaxID=722753 RepID=A0A9W7L539_9STRA|nr:hypothetical protein TrCOL_g2948 [Triparma columacea]
MYDHRILVYLPTTSSATPASVIAPSEEDDEDNLTSQTRTKTTGNYDNSSNSAGSHTGSRSDSTDLYILCHRMNACIVEVHSVNKRDARVMGRGRTVKEVFEMDEEEGSLVDGLGTRKLTRWMEVIKGGW